MRPHYDVVVVGGAVIGSAVAHYLAANPDFDGSILVVERDPSYARTATALSSASIRTQFSNPVNVKISQYGHEVIRDFASLMATDAGQGPDLHFQPGGYLFLANTGTGARVLEENHAVQTACGADIALWDGEEIARAFPHLRTDDLVAGTYGRSGEGWFDNTGLMSGFRTRARALGAEWVADEVVAIGREGARVTSVDLASGRRVGAGTIVDAAGPRAALVARMAGLDLPVEPRKRTTFIFACAASPEGTARVNGGRLPLMIDPSGVFCRPEGRYFLAGCRPVLDEAVDWDDFEPRHEEFDEVIWPALAARSEAFEALRVINLWAGHYDYNTLDQNLIVGRHPVVDNFVFANGFSGHGLQQAPAAGRAVSELIAYGGFRTLDLSEVGVERILERRPFLEKAVI